MKVKTEKGQIKIFRLAFLLSLNFLFTRGYYISTRVEVFHIIATFFNSVN